MSDNKLFQHWIVSSIVAPVIVAVVVGLASSYLTARLMLRDFDNRIGNNETRIVEIKDQHSKDMQALEREFDQADDRERRSIERLARIEAKIEVLLLEPK